ncbi:hypothetical protein LX32DRAFT_639454, partial [Colletotrichum zoysiae]
MCQGPDHLPSPLPPRMHVNSANGSRSSLLLLLLLLTDTCPDKRHTLTPACQSVLAGASGEKVGPRILIPARPDPAVNVPSPCSSMAHARRPFSLSCVFSVPVCTSYVGS